MAVPPSNLAAVSAPARLKVMVVDDSSIMRSMIVRVLEEDKVNIEVVAQAANGLAAVDRARKGDIDVVVLDIEMPVMDGLTTLPALLALKPPPIVIMASTLTTRNADISLRALAAGAKDYVPKPSAVTPGSGIEEFKVELLQKVRTLGFRFRPSLRSAAAPSLAAPAAKSFALRPRPLTRPRALAIGSSTGGPNALVQVMKSLPAPLRYPVFITQHMPPTFTRLLAENLQRETGHPCAEAISGEAVVAGKVYVAPGDFHMLVRMQNGSTVIDLNKDAKENYCRPAVDPMLRSLSSLYSRGLLTVILTGMGQDGLIGCKAVTAAGGSVVAQDEATSVVWGMPGAVAKDGLCYAVVPLAQVGPEVAKAFGA